MPLTLTQAHAMVMIIAWMIFGSTGILFARYGRTIRLGNRRQLLGKAVWFQIHRLLLSLTPLLTLLGFFLILVRKGGQWVDLQVADLRSIMHSIFGGIIVCCTIVQLWLALYRCHPQSRYRYIFDWSHRIIGIVAFILTIPTIFLIILLMSRNRPDLIPIFSCWTAWMVVIIMVLEIIQQQQRSNITPVSNHVQMDDAKREKIHENVRHDTEAATNTNINHRRYDEFKFLLLTMHIIVTLTISIVFIVYICK
ncbi:hypothetical protein I4U23_023528 [Adineta vaga]|nr:hypothetical protein I4U23_023528 [Adineta vaga]